MDEYTVVVLDDGRQCLACFKVLSDDQLLYPAMLCHGISNTKVIMKLASDFQLAKRRLWDL